MRSLLIDLIKVSVRLKNVKQTLIKIKLSSTHYNSSLNINKLYSRKLSNTTYIYIHLTGH